ncbi:hypothetical protein OS493_007308 [Desmophyllum pertusum]|uniref:Ion transport domain-containing protein n=1 Tax=Desmophyllum pertusum TaxID=174260 RepID=A0A9X0CSB5_9CNID|nr:hypothetical protein OS493_007308 [Desmophyllum pertusum]
MMLLFRLSTGSGWNDIMNALSLQPPDCDPNKGFPKGNCGSPLGAAGYLISYIVIVFMIIVNMYIAVILENVNRATKMTILPSRRKTLTGTTKNGQRLFQMENNSFLLINCQTLWTSWKNRSDIPNQTYLDCDSWISQYALGNSFTALTCSRRLCGAFWKNTASHRKCSKRSQSEWKHSLQSLLVGSTPLLFSAPRRRNFNVTRKPKWCRREYFTIVTAEESRENQNDRSYFDEYFQLESFRTITRHQKDSYREPRSGQVSDTDINIQ